MTVIHHGGLHIGGRCRGSEQDDARMETSMSCAVRAGELEGPVNGPVSSNVPSRRDCSTMPATCSSA